MEQRARVWSVFAGILGLASCGNGDEAGGAAPVFGHVVVVVEENANYQDVMSNAGTMPYLRALAERYGLATQYYANTHPSIGNYMMLATGQVLTNDSNALPETSPIDADNVVRRLLAAGKTWRVYAEGLPAVGYIGGDTGSYAVRHNPFAYLSDVRSSLAQQGNLVPFTQFALDMQRNELPDYAFIVPDLCDDAHDCGLDVADRWLQTNIAPLLNNPSFQEDGLLVITFDESATDNIGGGGRVATVLASPAFSKSSYRSDMTYQHESLLRLSLEALGISSMPGAAAGAPQMSEFFCMSRKDAQCQ